MQQLFARMNLLLVKFNKCNTDVELCVFKAYCMSFDGKAGIFTYSTDSRQQFYKCISISFKMSNEW